RRVLFRSEAASDKYQAAMSACYVFGYRLALLVAGAGALYIGKAGGWQLAYTVMALLMGVGIVTVLLVREPPRRRPPALDLDREVEQAAQAGGHLPAGLSRAIAWFVSAVAGDRKSVV